jgi:hypothetical protein
MRIQEIREAVGRQPFEPFRMVTTDGAAFELRHLDLCMFGVHGTILVGVPRAGSNEPLYERYVTIDASHVVRIEAIGQPVRGNASPGTS